MLCISSAIKLKVGEAAIFDIKTKNHKMYRSLFFTSLEAS